MWVKIKCCFSCAICNSCNSDHRDHSQKESRLVLAGKPQKLQTSIAGGRPPEMRFFAVRMKFWLAINREWQRRIIDFAQFYDTKRVSKSNNFILFCWLFPRALVLGLGRCSLVCWDFHVPHEPMSHEAAYHYGTRELVGLALHVCYWVQHVLFGATLLK